MPNLKSSPGIGILVASLLQIGAAILAAAPARPQSANCQRIAQQIESLSYEGGVSDPGRQAEINRQIQSQRAEAAQITAYMRSVGCGQTDLRFGGDASSECQPLGQRLRVMQQSIARLSQQALQGGRQVNAARRQTLLNSYDAFGCTDPIYDGDAASSPYQRQPREAFRRDDPYQGRDNFFDPGNQNRRSGVTFGSSPPGSVVPPLPDEMDSLDGGVTIDNQDRQAPQPRQGFAGKQPVCVRLCDGFFFPLSGASGPAEAQDMCQAQCPQSKTTVFLRTPNGEIGDAADIEGNTYSSLPNALKYRTKTVETCTCKKSDQSWSATLKPAEDLIDKKNEDLVVTEKNADDIARGKLKPPGADAKSSQRRDGGKADGDAVLSDVPLRTGPRPNVRIIDTGKARVP